MAEQLGDEAADFKLDKILSEKAWISYSFADQIAVSDDEKKELLQAASRMLLDALKANPKNTTAKTRLGTLIHLLGKTHLADINMTQNDKNERV